MERGPHRGSFHWHNPAFVFTYTNAHSVTVEATRDLKVTSAQKRNPWHCPGSSFWPRDCRGCRRKDAGQTSFSFNALTDCWIRPGRNIISVRHGAAALKGAPRRLRCGANVSRRETWTRYGKRGQIRSEIPTLWGLSTAPDKGWSSLRPLLMKFHLIPCDNHWNNDHWEVFLGAGRNNGVRWHSLYRERERILLAGRIDGVLRKRHLRKLKRLRNEAHKAFLISIVTKEHIVYEQCVSVHRVHRRNWLYSQLFSTVSLDQP